MPKSPKKEDPVKHPNGDEMDPRRKEYRENDGKAMDPRRRDDVVANP